MSDTMEGAEAQNFDIEAPRVAAQADACIPRFYMYAKRDGAKSRALGREVFFDVEFVAIMVPGNRLSEHHAEVEDKHRERWPSQYGRFKSGQEMAHDGTPLEAWAYLTPALVRDLKAVKIFNIEGLSLIADQNLHNLRHVPNIRKLRDMAIDWLAMAEDDAALYQLRHRVEELEIERDNDKDKIAGLEQALAAAREGAPTLITNAVAPGPGAAQPAAEPVEEPEPQPDSLSTAMAARKKGKRKRK